MLGCGNMAAFAATGQNAASATTSENGVVMVVSGEACASGGAPSSSPGAGASNNHSCCKKSSAAVKPAPQPPDARIATAIEFSGSSSGMMTDCPLAGSKAAVVTKTRGDGAPASQAVAHSYYPAPKSQEQPDSLSAIPLLPNRGHTYLRCCVFLI